MSASFWRSHANPACQERPGAKLFNRTPEGFAITSASQAMLKQAEAMEAAALAVERLASGHDERSSGLVRVTTLEMLARQVVVPAIANLMEMHPQLRVDLLVSLRTLDIARRQADIAVRIARPTDASLICRKLGEFGVTAYASRRYLEKYGRPQRGAGLRGHSVINYLITPASLGVQFHGESLDGARFAMQTSASAFTQMEAVANGVGIAELPCCLADEHPQIERVWPMNGRRCGRGGSSRIRTFGAPRKSGKSRMRSPTSSSATRRCCDPAGCTNVSRVRCNRRSARS